MKELGNLWMIAWEDSYRVHAVIVQIFKVQPMKVMELLFGKYQLNIFGVTWNKQIISKS